MTITVWAANGTYNGRALRQTNAVSLAGATAARPLGARSGVRPGTSSTTVTATATTWTVGPHAGVLDLEAAAEAGPYCYSTDANVTGTVTAASVARTDLVWVRLDDPAEGDGSSVPGAVFGYTAGSSVTPPATPARAMVLAWINVPASGGGAPTVTWKAPYAVAAGAPIPVYNQAERDAFAAYDGLNVYRLDLHAIETYNAALAAWTGGAWVTYTPTLTGLAVGTGAMLVQYRREGLDLVRVRYNFVIGSGAALSSPRFSLPFPSIPLRVTFEMVGFGTLAIVGARYMSTAALSSATTVQINYLGPSGLLTDVTLAAPATWAVGDILAGEFTYRAA